MAYEYEHEHRNKIAVLYSKFSTNESIEELKEVYRKANAFDEIAIKVLQESEISDAQMNGEITQIIINNLEANDET